MQRTSTIRTRSSISVSFELVEVLLGQDFTVREAYLAAYPILDDLDLLEVCLPLLEYLQVATTQPSTGNPRPPTIQDRLGRADYYRPPSSSPYSPSQDHRLHSTGPAACRP
jgi:hypothetical protein